MMTELVDYDRLDVPTPDLRDLGGGTAGRDGPQTLRGYDRLGLVVPGRSCGRGRRYCCVTRCQARPAPGERSPGGRAPTSP